MVQRKMQHRQETDKKWPLSIDEFMQELDKGPLPELYNAIFYTLEDTGKKNQNEHCYCVTGIKLAATKILSVASDWHSLITKESSPKQAVLG